MAVDNGRQMGAKWATSKVNSDGSGGGDGSRFSIDAHPPLLRGNYSLNLFAPV